MTLLGELTVEEPQLRLEAANGRRALEVVLGLPAAEAVVKLRFGRPSCEPLARLIEKALVQAEQAGELIVTGGAIETAEDIVRVRRKAHGKADWIASPTSWVRIELRPAGLVASSPDFLPEAPTALESPDVTVITMTLTSPACPLAAQIEKQIRRRLRGRVRIEWVWSPAWRPSDISAGGRWELSAIGFSF